MVKPPEDITKSNWKQHLGEDAYVSNLLSYQYILILPTSYYKAYLDFFTKVVQEQGTSAVVHEYVFAFDSNFSHDGTDPAMLSRLLAAAFHPMILLGSGLEFGMPGLVAEGLAQAAVHKDESGDLLAPIFFKHCFEDVGVTSQTGAGTEKGQHSTFASRLDTLMHRLHISRPRQKGGNVHALTVMSRVLKDERFSGVKEAGLYEVYPNVAKRFNESLRDYAGQWSINMKLGALVQNRKEVEDKLEELAWAYTIMYGLSGWRRNQPFNADFFLSCIIASAIFLPSFLAKLDVPSQALLLRAHFAAALTWWVGKGRPNVDIDGFMSNPPSELSTNPSNPFDTILQSAIVHDESHVSEFQRVMAHWSRLYGLGRAKEQKLSATELGDSDMLDGTLFIRVAEMTMDRTNRPREAVSEKDIADLIFKTWDRTGFYASP
ncbi:hypothetical protein AX15_007389 [Amanita polypyramis BW_CC]|nr:hypothetical protein AX15_007389 [Amanita polypyramis BW_CC]